MNPQTLHADWLARLDRPEQSEYLVMSSVRRSAALLAARARFEQAHAEPVTSRDLAREVVRRRALAAQRLGLSNPPYLAAGLPEGPHGGPARGFELPRRFAPADTAWELSPGLVDSAPDPVALLELHVAGQVAAASSAPLAASRLADWSSASVPSVHVGAAPVLASAAPATAQIRITPSRVRVQLSDQLADHLSPPRPVAGQRGSISELSERSRNRMADTATGLQECGQVAQLMLTLTSPANWLDIYAERSNVETRETVTGGRVFKEHMHAFRRRLDRVFKKKKWGNWCAFWFVEFQKRGAPHVHIMLFGIEAKLKTVENYLKKWCGAAWAEIVGNSNKDEWRKHKRAGTRVEKMRVKHFGYAQKYASKLEQKTVPTEFRHVGRFWGLWNYKLPKGVEFTIDFKKTDQLTHDAVKDVLFSALKTVLKHSPMFVANTIEKILKCIENPRFSRFGFSVYGGDAGRAVCDLFGVDWQCILNT